jgi:RNA polymerase sigma factor (sigma-70 family)
VTTGRSSAPPTPTSSTASTPDGLAAIHRTASAIFRIEAPKLIAALARIVRDVGVAEELAQDAFVTALEQWPQDGIPDRPGAWLMATAKHRALDRLRHQEMARRKQVEVGIELDAQAPSAADVEEAALDDIGDDLLRLVFTACHPVLPPEAKVALTLRLLGGLSTAEIARAFLVSEPTIAQRIVRAKRTLAEARVPFEVPRGAELAERLGAVLDVVYLVFNEGYAATAGEDWMRPHLVEDALRLGRILAGLMPDDAEVHGLLALMELHASRMPARLRPDGSPVLLHEQNRARWDRLLVRRGLAALARAEAGAGEPGLYVLQAQIAACHARATTAEATDWSRIASLYAQLSFRTGSPVVELNRAVAVAMADGPAAGLAVLDALADEPLLERYHLLPAARGDLLEKLGRPAEAKAAFERAASLAQTEREKSFLRARAAACAR